MLVVNGARATNNNFTLDGVDNNESQFGQIAIYPNPDAIAEFKIESSVPSAESGRAGGGIISTTFKSGGNDFHGTVGEIYQGRFLSAAASKFDDPTSPPVPNYVTHNYYGTVGGPIFLPRPGEGSAGLLQRPKSFVLLFLTQRPAKQHADLRRHRRSAGSAGSDSEDARRRFQRTVETRNDVRTIRLAGGGTVVAPIGTIFAPNGTPIPGKRSAQLSELRRVLDLRAQLRKCVSASESSRRRTKLPNQPQGTCDSRQLRHSHRSSHH